MLPTLLNNPFFAVCWCSRIHRDFIRIELLSMDDVYVSTYDAIRFNANDKLLPVWSRELCHTKWLSTINLNHCVLASFVSLSALLVWLWFLGWSDFAYFQTLSLSLPSISFSSLFSLSASLLRCLPSISACCCLCNGELEKLHRMDVGSSLNISHTPRYILIPKHIHSASIIINLIHFKTRTVEKNQQNFQKRK